ncbi:MAG: hypothetical protein JSR77_14000 [Planctomycetes bacterium]|nr:hypothetical protein [Planctomycetota bacterium]
MSLAVGWPTLLLLAITASAGAALLIWGMFGDLASGRLRCPACWYSLIGIAPTESGERRCPECGHVCRGEREARRSRRRWWAVIIGGAACMGVTVVPVYRWAASGAWMPYTPDTALIALVGRPGSGWAYSLLTDRLRVDDLVLGRLEQGRLWEWQRSMLIKRCAAAAGDLSLRIEDRDYARYLGELAARNFADRELVASGLATAASNEVDAPRCSSPQAIIAAAEQGGAALIKELSPVVPNVLGDVVIADEAGDAADRTPLDATRLDLEFDGQEGLDCIVVVNQWPMRQVFILLARRGVTWRFCGSLSVSRPVYSGERARIETIGGRPFLVYPQSVAHGSDFRNEREVWCSLTASGISEAAQFPRLGHLDTRFALGYDLASGITDTFVRDGKPGFNVSFKVKYTTNESMWERIQAPGVEEARKVHDLFERSWTQRYVWSDRVGRFVVESWAHGGVTRTDTPPTLGVRKSTFNNFVRLNHDALLEFAGSGAPGAREWVTLLPRAWPTAPAAQTLAEEAASLPVPVRK